MDQQNEFYDFLKSNGFEPKDRKIIEGKWSRAYFDGEKQPSARYIFTLAQDGFANGTVICEKAGYEAGAALTWHSKSDEKPSAEDIEKRRKEQEIRNIENQKKLNKEYERRHKLLSVAIKNLPKATDHPYLTRKQIKPFGIKHRAKNNELIIPLYTDGNKTRAIQRIGENYKLNKFDGTRGCYFPIADKDDNKSIIAIGEGFATCASVRMAFPEMPVIVAFTSSQLSPVAQTFRKKYPNSKILIIADNDMFTFKAGKKPKNGEHESMSGNDEKWIEWLEKGYMKNVGNDAAEKAASAIGGAYIVSPEFQDLESKPTDFNDLHVLEGIDKVKDQIDKVISRMSLNAVADIGGAGNSHHEQSLVDDNLAVNAGVPFPDYSDVKDPKAIDKNFEILGYNEGIYYYYPHGSRQIVALSASAHTIQNLLQLDSLSQWEAPYRHLETMPSHSKITVWATNELMRRSVEKGVFLEEDRARGCGVWRDEDRIIVHAGDALYVDGNRASFGHVKSRYTYVAASRLMRVQKEHAGNKHAHILREICERITWENPLSGILLSGWCVIAPICAALEYRPHIWIVGQSESGKSTVVDKIIKPVLGNIAMHVHGGTTEPALRDMMGYDARPILYDEAESEETRGTTEAVIGLARKASTGSVIKKFGQRPFKARFSMCFSGINPAVHKTADKNRISFLVLKKDKRPDAMERYDQLCDLIDAHITEDFSEMLLARTVKYMDVLMENITIFQRAARKVIGGARASQQIGTMLAGAYLLSSSKVIEFEKAKEWIAQFEWNNHTAIDSESDSERLLQYISNSLVRWSPETKTSRENSIGELIMVMYEDPLRRDADSVLRNHGIAVKDGRVYFSNSAPQMAKILDKKEWFANWSRTLGDLDGAVKEGNTYFSAGLRSRAVSIPISYFQDKPTPMQQSLVTEEEIPF